MTLTAALILLLACSDPFATDWQFADKWVLGMRKSAFTWQAGPDGSVLQGQGTSSPWATDYLLTYARALERDERPFIQLWIKVPTLPTQGNGGTGSHQYFGFRSSEVAAPNQLVWPGIFICRNESGLPSLNMRALADNIPTSFIVQENEWLTLGVSWNSDGALQCYAHSGKVELTEADKIAEDNGTILNAQGEWETNPFYIKHMVRVTGIFLDIADVPGIVQPIWTLAKLETWACPRPPVLDTSTDGIRIGLFMHGGYAGVGYNLQKSLDLLSWDDIAPMSNGDLFTDPMMQSEQFYRLSTQ